MGQFFLCPADIFPVVGDGSLQDRNGSFLLLDLGFHLRGLGADGLGLQVLRLHPLTVALAFGVEPVQLRTGLVPLALGLVELRLELALPGLQGVQILQPHGDLQKAQLVTEHQVLFRLFRLVPQRLHLKLQLGDLIVDAHQVFLRALKLAL